MEVLGIIAILFGAAAYKWKSPRHIMLLSAAASAMWVLYFISISQWGPMLITLTYIFVLIAGAYTTDRSVRILSIAQAAIATPLIILTMSGLPMLLALGGNLLKSVIPILRARPYLYRFVFATAEAMWLTFGLVVGAHSTVAGSTIAISASLGSGLYYFWKERRSNRKVAASRLMETSPSQKTL
jgi:hypothetical protein